MTPRWLIVVAVAAVLIVTPLGVHARPALSSDRSAADLVAQVQQSGGQPWSGLVETSGALAVPDSDSFASLAQLLGEDNDLRVWWRSAEDWRVDRIRSTGETDLFRQQNTSIRWVFESQTAVVSPVSTVRLPDASDLLPPSLGRSMLRGARAEELSRLPSRRLAGLDAPGVRLEPADAAATVDHVDLWVDPATGLALRVDVFGAGDTRPVVTTALTELDTAAPDPVTTAFRPAVDVKVQYDQSVDVAAAANAFAPYDLPTTLAGLGSRTGEDPGAVGVYGRGPTTMIVLPLRGQVAGPLRDRLRSSATAQTSALGALATAGPVGLLVTRGRFDPQRRGNSFLLAGTVTPEVLERAAAELQAQP